MTATPKVVLVIDKRPEERPIDDAYAFAFIDGGSDEEGKIALRVYKSDVAGTGCDAIDVHGSASDLAPERAIERLRGSHVPAVIYMTADAHKVLKDHMAAPALPGIDFHQGTGV